jgi:hypothetical protein
VQAVAADQQPAAQLGRRSSGITNKCRDAVGVVTITDDAVPRAHGVDAEPVDHRAVQQHLQRAAMHGVLRPPVPREQAARLRVHVLAVQTDERPLARLHADCVQVAGTDVELVELAHGVRLKVDADAERFQLRDGLEHDARHADLLQRESNAESADTATGNDHGQIGHRTGRLRLEFPRTRMGDSRLARKRSR